MDAGRTLGHLLHIVTLDNDLRGGGWGQRMHAEASPGKGRKRLTSSFCAVDSITVTPSSMSTLRTIWENAVSVSSPFRYIGPVDGKRTFSPRKLRISTDCLSPAMMTLMGK